MELEELVTWHPSPISDQEICDLPERCFGTVEVYQDGTCTAWVACHDTPDRRMVIDRFARVETARAWIEDKALLIHKGLPLGLGGLDWIPSVDRSE